MYIQSARFYFRPAPLIYYIDHLKVKSKYKDDTTDCLIKPVHER